MRQYNEPIVIWKFNPNSVSHINNQEYVFRLVPRGLMLNTYDIIENAEKNNIPKELIEDEINFMFCKAFSFYALNLKYNLPYKEETKQVLIDFYNNIYKNYREQCYSRIIPITAKFNIIKPLQVFMEEL